MLLPLVIEVDADAESKSAPAPTDAHRLFAAQPAADALAPPQPSVTGDATPAAPANASAVRDVVLRIVLGAEEKYLKCTQEDVMGFVGMSYLSGGFPMVIASRRAIDAGLKGLHDDFNASRDGLVSLENMASDRGRPLSAQAAGSALHEARQRTDERQSKLQRARSAYGAYTEYFRNAWNALAAYEEALLRSYERELAKALRKLGIKNKNLAASEWEKYAPVSADDKPLAFETAKADEVVSVALNKSLAEKLIEEEKSSKEEPNTKKPKDQKAKPEDQALTKVERTRALKRLWQIALDLRQRAEAIHSDQEVKTKSAGAKAAEQARLRELSNLDRMQAWHKERQKVADTYPVLLQVYPGFTSIDQANSILPRMAVEIAGALLRTRDECNRIAKDAVVVWNRADRLCIVPQPKKNSEEFEIPGQELDRPIGRRQAARRFGREYDDYERDVPLRSVLESAHLKAAADYGLTIPASEVVAGLLKNDANLRRNSGWLHAPVGFELMRRSETETMLAPFFAAGTVQHAAVSCVLDRLADSRERDKTWESRGMMFMWGAATLLAPFTEGASLAGAALVQASVAAHEIFDSVSQYQSSTALSSVSLSAIEEAAWCRPSTLNLVRTLVADVSDIAQGAFGAKGLPIALDLVLGALSLLHPDAPPEKRAP